MHAFVTPTIPDLPPSPDTLHIYPDTSIGIAEIRQVQIFLSKKPLQSPANAVILHDAHLLTLPAQQAFLKTLEEPPSNSQIYLVTSQPDSLLPTILSRCEIIKPNNVIPSEVEESLTQLITSLLSTDKVGERLALLDSQNFTRETALTFLDNLEYFLQTEINSPKTPPLTAKTRTEGENLRGGLGALCDLIFETRKYLKSNVSVRLAIDHLALNL